jgi:hypothetical protein
MLAEDLSGEAGADMPGTCNWYPQDSMEIDAMLAQELGLLITGPEKLRSDESKAFGVARPTTVCEQAYSILQIALGLHNTEATFLQESRPCNSEVLSLKTFLDEEVPKFPFACSPNSAATWTRVTA